ncbi:MAG: hypothetical protein MPI93_04870, partial [Nitrosopumilus sp.]|nr:hypothetical protein [Nitrosopumilus sp.]
AELGDHADAVMHYDSVLESRDCYYGALAYKEFLLDGLGRHGEARECDALMMDVLPDYGTILLKGLSLAALGRHADAVRCYDRVLRSGKNGRALEARDASLRALDAGAAR